METIEPPIKVNHLFSKLHLILMASLKDLSANEWQLPTLAGSWTVKDVVAHLLDGNVKTISKADGHRETPPPRNGYTDLVGLINQHNAIWVNAMKRVSPQLLMQVLDETNALFVEKITSLPLFEPAEFGVAWAGEEISLNWFHVAREYTEKWHHQQQIWEAVNGKQPPEASPLMAKDLFFPFIDTLLRGLPHAMRNIPPAPEHNLQVTISTEAGGKWWVFTQNYQWIVSKNVTDNL